MKELDKPTVFSDAQQIVLLTLLLTSSQEQVQLYQKLYESEMHIREEKEHELLHLEAVCEEA